MKYKIILASNSPRRRELLAGLDVNFEVKVLRGIDESYPEDLMHTMWLSILPRRKRMLIALY